MDQKNIATIIASAALGFLIGVCVSFHRTEVKVVNIDYKESLKAAEFNIANHQDELRVLADRARHNVDVTNAIIFRGNTFFFVGKAFGSEVTMKEYLSKLGLRPAKSEKEATLVLGLTDQKMDEDGRKSGKYWMRFNGKTYVNGWREVYPLRRYIRNTVYELALQLIPKLKRLEPMYIPKILRR